MYTIEVESLLSELLADMELNVDDLPINEPIDVSNLKYQLLDLHGEWNNILKVIRKPNSKKYEIIYSDILECSEGHAVLVNNITTNKEEFKTVEELYNNTSNYLLKTTNGFVEFNILKLDEEIKIVDFELDNTHAYLTNGIQSHNTMFGDPYCVDPFTTKIKIRKTEDGTYEEYEISLADFYKEITNIKSVDLNDSLSIPKVIPLEEEYLVLSYNEDNDEDEWKPIINFVVKDKVYKSWSDGKLTGTSNHLIKNENGEYVKISEHPDFEKINKSINVVDIEVADNHNYYANGRLNHNTTSGGKAIPFHSSLRLRLKSTGKIKKGNDVIGIKTKIEAIKSRVGPSFRPVDFDIYYTHGMDANSSWFEVGKKYGAIVPAEKEEDGKVKKVKGWYSIKGHPDIKFQSTKMKDILNDPTLKDTLYNAIKDASRLEYIDQIPDDVEVEDSTDEIE